MSINKQPGSENSNNLENQDSLGKRHKKLGNQKETFQKISKLQSQKNNDTKNALADSRKSQDKLQAETNKNITKLSEVQNNTEKTQSYPTIEKHFAQANEENTEYIISSDSGMSLEYQNSIKGAMIGCGKTAMSTIETCGKLTLGIVKTPKDIYDLIAGNAYYDGFKNV